MRRTSSGGSGICYVPKVELLKLERNGQFPDEPKETRLIDPVVYYESRSVR